MTLLLVLLVIPTAPVDAEETLQAVTNGGFELAAHQARPLTCTVFGPGYINIVDPDNPFGLPWLVAVSPCNQGVLKAAGWSSGTTVDVADFDGDGDREAKFIAGPPDVSLGNHNLWQAYPSGHQAFVANFSALQFTLSAPAPTSAAIVLSLSTSPIADPSPYVGLFLDCQLRFPSALIGSEAGLISIDPTDGIFTSLYAGDELAAGCDELAAAWNAAEPRSTERREILDGLRLVQHSYWNWNSGSSDVVIDEITMTGSRTVLQALTS